MLPELEMPYLCDALGLKSHELAELDRYEATMLLAYDEGKSLGEWASVNRQNG